jgi:hypothetical protein
MLGLLVADIIIAAGLYLVGFLSTMYKKMLHTIAKHVLKQYLLLLIVFNSFNVG